MVLQATRISLVQCMNSYWTYILASRPRGTLYIGVTNSIVARVERHRTGSGSAFTRRYKVFHLVWYEEFGCVDEAIQREKTMKEWRRDWKLNLIERDNPHWQDLYPLLPGVRPLAHSRPSRALGPGDKPRDDSGG